MQGTVSTLYQRVLIMEAIRICFKAALYSSRQLGFQVHHSCSVNADRRFRRHSAGNVRGKKFD